MQRRTTLTALGAAALLALAACSSHGSDSNDTSSAAPPPPSSSSATETGSAPQSSTAPSSSAAAGGPGSFGTLGDVCGPGSAKGATDTGVTDTSIHVGTVADVGWSAAPGLLQPVWDSSEAFVDWCNAAGGINGRKLELDKRDAAYSNYLPQIKTSCDEDLAIVSMGILDDTGVDEWEKCGLLNFTAATVGEKAANAKLMYPMTPIPADQQTIGGFHYYFEQHPDWEAQASAKYREGAAAGRRVSGARVWQIMERVRQLRRESVAMFERFDVIAMPAAAALPWPAHEAYPTHIDGQAVGPRGHAAYTGWVNAAGLPGLSVPAAPSREGLPIGLQLIGPFGGDDLLLELGAAYEAAAPWADRWPAL